MVGQFLGFPGQGLLQVTELALALVLSALIGVEREIRQKSAGLRTHTLVGVSAALFMLVSKYGFDNILAYGRIVLDPSRIAAQVVSGIGFIGGGVIFMRRDVVRGLTTAASVWFTAALGMACGAGLVVLALATIVGYFIIMLAFPMLARRLPRSKKLPTEIQISYQDGRGLLRTILLRCTDLRFSIDRVGLEDGRRLETIGFGADNHREAVPPPKGNVTVTMLVRGKRPISHLVAALSDIDGVREVACVDHGAEFE
ncbi:MgtC/SapB family protein [Acidocella sp.]|uniref:MgtC/SapB family protein n=1 Tax=Acidocella sp. TaxID=50710 RepID=UPI003D0564C1